MSDIYNPSDSYVKEFVTKDATGALVVPDSLPTAVCDFYGTGSGSMSLSVASIATGHYKATGTIPSGRVTGDRGEVFASASISSIITGNIIDSFQVGTIKADVTQVGGVAANIAKETGGALAALVTTVGSAGAGLTAIAAKVKKYLQLMVRKDAAIATDNATELGELNASGGSGAGAFDNTTDSEESLRDRGDAAWVTATGFSTATKLRKYLQLIIRKDAFIATDNATELGELNADGGSGSGTFDNTTDAEQGIADTM
jgi:hypothetical protein